MTLTEKEDGPGEQYNFNSNTATSGNWADVYPDGSNRHPLPALFHELVHGYQDLVTGSRLTARGSTKFENNFSAPKLEREAVGLPWVNSNGEQLTGEELSYTDNKFRRELNFPARQFYGDEEGYPIVD